jgi:phage/plasmid-associated DNA primase
VWWSAGGVVTRQGVAYLRLQASKQARSRTDMNSVVNLSLIWVEENNNRARLDSVSSLVRWIQPNSKA